MTERGMGDVDVGFVADAAAGFRHSQFAGVYRAG
jgi:hypothetical protein